MKLVLAHHTPLRWCVVLGRRLKRLGVSRAYRLTVYRQLLDAEYREFRP